MRRIFLWSKIHRATVLEEEEIRQHEPHVVLVGDGNRIRSQSREIIAGTHVG